MNTRIGIVGNKAALPQEGRLDDLDEQTFVRSARLSLDRYIILQKATIIDTDWHPLWPPPQNDKNLICYEA